MVHLLFLKLVLLWSVLSPRTKRMICRAAALALAYSGDAWPQQSFASRRVRRSTFRTPRTNESCQRPRTVGAPSEPSRDICHTRHLCSYQFSCPLSSTGHTRVLMISAIQKILRCLVTTPHANKVSVLVQISRQGCGLFPEGSRTQRQGSAQHASLTWTLENLASRDTKLTTHTHRLDFVWIHTSSTSCGFSSGSCRAARFGPPNSLTRAHLADTPASLGAARA